MAKFLCNLISYTLRRTVDLTVILPTPTVSECTDGTAMHAPKSPYPVLYLLHGMGNNQATWTGYSNLELFAEERQIAVVNFAAENKGYLPTSQDDYFAFMTRELPDFICGLFPISERPEDTYLAGLSMGGYGTLIYGLNFPERFAAIGAFSGAIRIPPVEGRDPGPQFDPYALADGLLAAGRPLPALYLACGTEDFLYRDNLAFRDHLCSAGVDLTWEALEGYTHEWRFWNIEIEHFLDWIPRTDLYSRRARRGV